MDEETAVEPTIPVDLDVITHECICGSNWWNLQVFFDDFEIAGYLLSMFCVACGSKAIAPCLPDKPGWVREESW